MRLDNRFRTALGPFIQDEAGNVTIDWVLVTAGVVSMSVAVMISISTGTQEYSEKMDTALSTRNVTTTY
ncbi:MAG: hypothetical protein ACR2OY_06560 [Boseongicola sp.]